MTKKHKAGRIEMQIATLMNPFCLPLSLSLVREFRLAAQPVRHPTPAPGRNQRFSALHLKGKVCFLETLILSNMQLILAERASAFSF
jgi:hypothetical protein